MAAPSRQKACIATSKNCSASRRSAKISPASLFRLPVLLSLAMTLFRWLTTAALLLCTVVVVFGAYVRLSDAGLGCPDWPGCYGSLAVPSAAEHVTQAQQQFPQRPLEQAKAWKEMIHRY